MLVTKYCCNYVMEGGGIVSWFGCLTYVGKSEVYVKDVLVTFKDE